MPRRLARALAVVGLALCAATPILASAIAVGRGWVPVSDSAIVATRARDVFSAETPLLGQPSTAGIDVGEDVHHPGPLEYWVIAAAQGLHDGPAASLVAVVLVNLAAVVAAVVVAARAGGLGGAASTAAVLAALTWSLRGEILADPLNPYAALVPFAAYLVGCVAVAARRWWALVPGVVLGSYAAQAHLTTAAMVGLATAGTALGLLVTGAAGEDDRGGWRRPLLVSVAVLLACWAAPIADVVLRAGGNVAALAATGGARTAGDGAVRSSFDKTANAVGPRPVWLRSGADVPSLLERPRAVESAATVGLTLAAVAFVVAARRRHRPAAAAAAIAATLATGGTLLFARFPTAFFNVFAIGNYLWLWPASALLWAAVAAGAVSLVRTRLPSVLAPAAATGAAIATAVFAVSAIADPTARPVDRGNPAIVRSLSAQLARGLDRNDTYLFDLSVEFDEQAVDTGVVHELVRRGFDVRVTRFFAPSYDWRADPADVDGVLRVVVDRDAPESEGDLVASYTPPPEARRRLERAERAVVDRLEAGGGLDEDLFPAFGKPVPPSVEAFVQGDFTTMAATGFLGETARWPETEQLAAARRQPVLRAAVFLRPPTDP